MKSEGPRFIFFGGKGGVGKTTCAAARALAEAAAGRRVLIVSTDPAHSLGDALDVRLSSRVTRIRAGRRTMWGLELDGPRAYARWLREHRRALGDAIEHGTWLDREDIDALLQLSVPGIDELVALLEIVRVGAPEPPGRGRAYDLIVIDTAPTGHTLRLLAAPGAVAAVADTLDALQREHRLIREQLARIGRPEAADRLVALLAGQAQQTGALLRDPTRAEFHWITLPEPMSIAESEDGLRALRRSRVRVAGVIVNRVLPAGPACPVCDRRRAEERKAMASIPARLPGRPAVRVLHAEIPEPRGVAALTRIGRRLDNGIGFLSLKSPAVARPLESPVFSSIVAKKGVGALFSPDARLFFFGGKGGVGKTTTATATAIRLARDAPGRQVLLLSTDPAHSLGDIFGVAISDRPRTIPRGPKNLQVRELDAPAALAARRADLDAALDEVGDALGSEPLSGGVNEVMNLAPPGIDELLGVLEVAEEVRLKPDAIIVVDMAPTGHALRLLEMPEAAREWVQVVMGVLLKYRELVRPGKLGSELVTLSKSIRGLQDLLHDGSATRFVVVTRAAAVPRLETERLMTRLRRLKLPPQAVIVNALTLAPGRCPWCGATMAAERRELATLARAARARLRECVIILTPLTAPPPRGVTGLAGWIETWTHLPSAR